jgi:hypothetical protein
VKFVSRMPLSSRFSDLPPLGASDSMPSEFVEILDTLPAQIDRQLGYFGRARFVAFRYEPRAEDVMWSDESSFGIATGAWQIFHDDVEPIANLYDVNIGGEKKQAESVLLYDRIRATGYFASRQAAEAFLERRKAVMPNVA